MSKFLQDRIFLTGLVLFMIGAFSPVADGEFQQVLPGKVFQFPHDHGAHPDFPVEWWYFTGHLMEEGTQDVGKARAFGFELTFFRVAVNTTQVKARSPWHVQSLFLAHAAITDDEGEEFYFEKRLRRPNFSAAGASSEKLDVYLDDWHVKQLRGRNDSFALTFSAVSEKDGTPFRLSLNLESQKLPVLQGKDGYSQKGENVSDASYYVSLTRLTGEGELQVRGERRAVTAQAWLDHEILSSKPQDENVGWDWFAIQLDDNTECMLYHLRRGKEGKTTPYSSGSCVNKAGQVSRLSLEDYTISAVSSWRSSRTGITYPSGWQVEIPSQGLKLEILPTVRDQELSARGSVTRTYWEGRSLVSGTVHGRPIRGAAYVELVGYR